MRSVSHLLALTALGGLASFASLHCGAAGSIELLAADASPPSGDAGPELRPPDARDPTGQGGEAGPTSFDAGALREAGPPPLDNLIESNLLVLANGSSLPAFRLCPADTPGVPRSTSSQRPFPAVLMPGSSLEGVPERGAVGVLPTSMFAGKSAVVVLWIDAITKNDPGLLTASCSTLACVGGLGCLDNGTGTERSVTVVTLPNDAALDKKGILVLKGASRATARFETRTPRQSNNTAAGTLDVQLFNEASFGGKVSFEGATIDPSRREVISYTGFGGAFAADAHRETLLEVHGNSAPRRPVVDFYANPGLFALFLLGAPGDLTFVAVPTHQR